MNGDIEFDFKGKNCVVAGGASGMGRSIALHLAAAGANVAIADLNFEGAEKVAEEIRSGGGRAAAYWMDATAWENAEKAAAQVMDAFGEIHCLVNSIGIGAKAKENESYQETFERLIKVNLMGMFYSCSAFAEKMIETGNGGTIVNIASMSASIVPAKTRPGRGGEYGLIGYCSSKGAVKMMTKAIATLWAEYGIRANSVSPGYVDTPLTAEPHKNPETRKFLEESVPIHRIAQPEEIATAVMFLLSNDSGYITGEDLLIDGGFTAR